MDKPPVLTDLTALARHRSRARRAPALFLHEDAAAELQERLLEVNRRFTDAAIIADFPQPWQAVLPAARVIAMSDTLDLAEGSCDLIVHAMGLHWANDPVGQLVQCARALRPDGLFLAVFFGGQTLTELRSVLAEAEIAATGGLSPRVAPMGEIRDLGSLLHRAGFALPVADSVLRKVSYPDPLALMHDLRAMGETNAMAARIRHFTRPSVIAGALSRYAETCAEPRTEPGGRVHATFDMVWLTGWKPHPSQQKPLRPGSARHPLSEALASPDRPKGSDHG